MVSNQQSPSDMSFNLISPINWVPPPNKPNEEENQTIELDQKYFTSSKAIRDFISVERQKGLPLEQREQDYAKFKQNWILEKKSNKERMELNECTFKP